MSHKEIAASFLRMAGGGDVKAAYDKFIAPDFIHHNQYLKGDRQSLLVAMEDAHRTRPNKSIDVKQTFEDGDFVITHSRVTRADPKQAPIAVIHILRFKGDRVVELWDLGGSLLEILPTTTGRFNAGLFNSHFGIIDLDEKPAFRFCAITGLPFTSLASCMRLAPFRRWCHVAHRCCSTVCAADAHLRSERGSAGNGGIAGRSFLIRQAVPRSAPASASTLRTDHLGTLHTR